MTGALRALAVGLFAVGLVVALVGTGGFTSATADRGVAVATVEDDRAYVGYDSPDDLAVDTDGDAVNGSDVNGSDPVALVAVTNRFDIEVAVTEVSIAEKPDDLNVTVRSPPSAVSPGESGSEAVVAELECEDTFEAEPLSVTVRLRGEDVEAVVFGDTENRTISVSCRAGA
ncbi:hypothetical protein [Halorubrum kocurii]|uniref:Uncharacterized protein n=1 Tax=Halorubrum kocurii JCM 14978 TaxID=1230456 RepID=M0NTW2_9EURY|nr:hypothetical protein [Halorubrum kocurii]EMA60050.1 hypothetical protein C468_13736 [Halorubrum kocurii JCM 14978]